MYYTRGCWELGWQSISFSACIETTRKRNSAYECGGEVGCGPLPSTAPCPQQPLTLNGFLGAPCAQRPLALNNHLPSVAPCPQRPLSLSNPLPSAAHCPERPFGIGDALLSAAPCPQQPLARKSALSSPEPSAAPHCNRRHNHISHMASMVFEGFLRYLCRNPLSFALFTRSECY